MPWEKGDATGLLEVDDVLDALDAVLCYVLVLLFAHVFVFGRDGKEHQDGLDGLLDELEEFGVEAPDVGEAVAVRSFGVEPEGGGPAIEALRVPVGEERWRQRREAYPLKGGGAG